MNIEIDFGNDGIKVQATLSRDGDKWCVLLGDNLQDGICGFGHQIGEAVANFKDNFRNETAGLKELFPGTRDALDSLRIN